MQVDIISQVHGARGMTLLGHVLKGKRVVGVNPNEPFSLVLRNNGERDAQVFTAFNGLNLATGRTLNGSNPTRLVRTDETVTFNDIVGEPLVFGDVPSCLASSEDRYDIAPPGCISVALYATDVSDALMAAPDEIVRVFYVAWPHLNAQLHEQHEASVSPKSGPRNRRSRRQAPPVEFSRLA